ncbi:MAG: response regulator transcription factor [Arcobacter butzleri]|jgi:DNA-binding response OmpR family regulator|nr:response regulator transcription factor [Arcobacteraceae bacterium]MDY0365050.1 response regulator transcription factor [Arcobacteraceae bacterium]NLO16745.1 response regulator transcription factor [Aliarcobacter butzleri]
MKIVLIEDDIYLNTLIYDVLITRGYKVNTFADGARALQSIDEKCDLYIIDLSLPNVNGFDIAKKIKTISNEANIIVISAEDNIDTILKAYDLGCMDYIKKPFHVKELLAKVSLILSNKPDTKIELAKECIYDTKSKLLILEGKIIDLTQKETLLLHILVMNFGITVSNEEAERYIWGENVGQGYVRQLVSKIRKKAKCLKILNHSGNGYRIEINEQ